MVSSGSNSWTWGIHSTVSPVSLEISSPGPRVLTLRPQRRGQERQTDALNIAWFASFMFGSEAQRRFFVCELEPRNALGIRITKGGGPKFQQQADYAAVPRAVNPMREHDFALVQEGRSLLGRVGDLLDMGRPYLPAGSCSRRKTPFLLAVTMSSKPSPLKSVTTNWVPMPLWSSISRGVKLILPSAPRAASNQ